jgi:hypothetical protein
LTDAPKVSPLGAPIVFDASDSAGRVGIIRIEPAGKDSNAKGRRSRRRAGIPVHNSGVGERPRCALRGFYLQRPWLWRSDLNLRTRAGERARRESQEEWGMAGAESGGEEQPGAVIVPRMLEGQKRKILDERTLQFARISEQAS